MKLTISSPVFDLFSNQDDVISNQTYELLGVNF
jgi:hypothetical protein